MATRTKPLVTAATLASAAAIAVASPAIAPSLNLPTPHALSAAKVQLATFADVLSVPAVEWTDLLFGNTSWGGVLSSTNYGADYAKPQDMFLQPGYVNPWAAYCDGGCTQSGITGVAYLFFDALVNGDGKGYANSDKWSTGLMNYLWEPNSVFLLGSGSSPTLQYVAEGWSAASWYILQGTLGKAIPALTVPIAAAYWGPNNVSVFYNLGLSITAALVSQVPVVGPIAGNSILAYLGNLAIPNTNPVQYYPYGPSGALNYWIDIATGAAPFPSASTLAPAAALAAARTPVAAAATVTAPETPAVSSESKSATDAPASTPTSKAPESTPAAEASDNSPAAKAPESTPAADAPASTPAVDAPASTPVADTKASETPAPESTPAADAPASTPAVDAPASTPAADTKSTDSTPAPAKAAPKHPVRDAVEKVGKQINSAINNAKAAKAAKADSSS